jgi:hypothetical protein
MNKLVTRPCGAVYLKQDKVENSIFHVCHKEGIIIPDIFGQLYADNEFLILFRDFQSDENGIRYSLCTTNVNAGGLQTGEIYNNQGIFRLANFHLTHNRKGTAEYDDYVMLFDFALNYNGFSILFYDGLENYASNLLMVWEQELLEDRVA